MLLACLFATGCGGEPPRPVGASAPAATEPSATAPSSPSQPAGASPSNETGIGSAGSAAPSKRPSPSAEPSTRRYAFPVRARNVDYHPTHSAYPGTDLFAACGAPVVAVTDGTILEVSRVDRFDKFGPMGPNNGGKSVSLLGDDGVRYYGSHLTQVTAGVEKGVRVRAGQSLGTVGKTGNANNVCHLHFGISPPCARTGDWWIRRGVVWPAPYLDAWRKGTNRSPAAAVSEWHRKRGCPSVP
ncbi:M23 family metallopeptidase [Plantactinospora sp. GCM10030261]|uniref:M23 family metallopeptidase n=1 Tax=Plantactinospora sp. GCM10030261 TaxID=3273420 RepID=UPI00361911F2